MDDHSMDATHLLFEIWSNRGYEGDYDMGYNFLGEVGEGKEYEIIKKNAKDWI